MLSPEQISHRHITANFLSSGFARCSVRFRDKGQQKHEMMRKPMGPIAFGKWWFEMPRGSVRFDFQWKKLNCFIRRSRAPSLSSVRRRRLPIRSSLFDHSPDRRRSVIPHSASPPNSPLLRPPPRRSSARSDHGLRALAADSPSPPSATLSSDKFFTSDPSLPL
jgi:hypothetical protein